MGIPATIRFNMAKETLFTPSVNEIKFLPLLVKSGYTQPLFVEICEVYLHVVIYMFEII